MDNNPIHFELGQLKARCMILESRMASLAAFTAALLKDHPARDQLQTRWADYLGPALQQIGPGLDKENVDFAASVPGLVQHLLDQN